ncbi:hypothetical protein SAMN05216371_6386 [Streptomyces sp. TLI_053]|nr:hypothetical protein SAMN05216371_6386 [Streptomyces sp. TLI_053]
MPGVTDDHSRDRQAFETRSAEGDLADAAFLVTAPPDEVATVLSAALLSATAGSGARVAAAVYRASGAVHGGADPAARRQLLALDAARFGAHGLADRITAVPVPGAPVAAWRPVWATGSAVHPGRTGPEAAGAAPPAPVTPLDPVTPPAPVTPLDPTAPAPAATVTMDGRAAELRCDPAAGLLLDGEPLPGLHPDEVLALTLDGRPHALGGADERHLALWDLTTRRVVLELDPFGTADDLTGWTVALLDGEPHLLAGSFGGTLALHHLPSGAPRASARADEEELRLLVPLTVDGRPHALVAGCDRYVGEPVDRAELWSLDPLRPVDRLLIDNHEVGRVTAGGREFVRTGTGQYWDFCDLPPVRRTPGHREAVRALAVTVLDGREAVVTGGDDQTLLLRDLATGEPLAEPLSTVRPPDDWEGVVAMVADGPGRLVTEHVDRYENTAVRAWDLDRRAELGLDAPPPRPFRTHTLNAGGDGGSLTVTTHRHEVAVHDTATGEAVPHSALGATGDLTAVTTGTVHGRPAVAVADGRHVRVHAASPGLALLSELTLPARVTALLFTPDGRLLVAFGPDVALFGPTPAHP